MRGAQAQFDGNTQAASGPERLSEMRATHLHGVCHPGSPGGKGPGRLPGVDTGEG